MVFLNRVTLLHYFYNISNLTGVLLTIGGGEVFFINGAVEKFKITVLSHNGKSITSGGWQCCSTFLTIQKLKTSEI